MDHTAELAYDDSSNDSPAETPTGLGLLQASVHQRELLIEELCKVILRKAGSLQSGPARR